MSFLGNSVVFQSMTTTETPPEGTFPHLLQEKGLSPTDVVQALRLSESDTYKVLAGRILIRRRGNRGQPSQVALMAAYFDLSPDKIVRISQDTVDWRTNSEGNEK